MSNTITIDRDLFCEMIFSLYDQVSTKQQVDWLNNYGKIFYDLKLFEAVEDKHIVTKEFFDDITTEFWGEDDVLYKSITWLALSEKMGTNFYQNYLDFSFNSNKDIDDIQINLGSFNANNASRYYSPSLIKCIAAKLDLTDETEFYFTKAMMPNYKIGIVFKVNDGVSTYYYNISEVPT